MIERLVTDSLESIRTEMDRQNTALEFFIERNEYAKRSVAKIESFQVDNEGDYLNSNTNKMLNAMFDGFEKDTKNDDMTSLIKRLIWHINKDEITRENAVRVLEMATKNSNPPIDMEEAITIWNDVISI